MYAIERTDYGLHLVFSGHIERAELAAWTAELAEALCGTEEEFCVLVDMRYLEPLPDEALEPMIAGQKAALEMGMKRSIVIVDNALTALQFIKIAHDTGIHLQERYINVQLERDWRRPAMDWLIRGKEPVREERLFVESSSR